MRFCQSVILACRVCTLLIAAAFGLNNAAIMKLVPVYVSKSVGGASGWVGGLGAFGGFIIPPVLGKIACRGKDPGRKSYKIQTMTGGRIEVLV